MPNHYLQKIKDEIAANQLKNAMTRLQRLLDNSPQLNEILHQLGRYNKTLKDIQRGTISYEEANIASNRVRWALLKLVEEIEGQEVKELAIQKEIEQAVIHIENSKNVISGSTIKARDIYQGDKHEHYHYASTGKLPEIIGTPPFNPDTFLGREKDIKAIHQQLFHNDHFLLLVNGQGGIGKTTLAAKYFIKHKEKYNYRAWVYVEHNIQEAILSLSPYLPIEFEEDWSQEQRFSAVLDQLRTLEEPSLLVIDNANNKSSLEKHYMALKACPNLRILLTTRINDFSEAEIYPIAPLLDKDAKALFVKHYRRHQDKDDGLLADIFRAIGKNTLVIELMAKNLTRWNQLKVKYTLRELTEDLQKGLLSIQGKAVNTPYQGKGVLREATPEEIIMAMYDMSRLSQTEHQLMTIFSVLPAEKIDYDILAPLLPQEELIETSLIALFEKGWLDYNEEESTFKVSPVIQEVVKKKTDNLWEQCEGFVARLIDQLERAKLHQDNYLHSAKWVHLGLSIIQAIENPLYEMAHLCINIGNYFSDTGDLAQSLAMAKKSVNIFEVLLELYPNNVSFKNGLAISYSKLGETHSSLGQLDLALTFFEKDMALTEELYEAYPNNVSFKNGLAISYEKLGETHSSLGQLDLALTFFEDETTLFKELYEAYPNNVSFKNGLAISYEKLGETHSSLGQLDLALTFFEKRSRLGKELYEAYPNNVSFKNGLAISYSQLGRFYRDHKGEAIKAKAYFQQCHKLWKELATSFPEYVQFTQYFEWAKDALEHIKD